MTKNLKLSLKESFDVFSKYEAFYTGGQIQFSKNGQFILSMCHEHLKLFEIATGRIINFVDKKDEKEELSRFLLADDDEILITAGKNGIMRHWSFSTKLIQKTWKSMHNGPVSCMAFDSTITLLATGGTDSTVKIWDIVRKYYTHNFKGAQGVYSKICFHQIGSELFLFGCASDYKIRIWSLSSSKCIATLEGHYSTITDLVITNWNNTMLSCSRDKVVLLWDLKNYKLLKTIPIFEAIEVCILVPSTLSLPNVSLNKDDIYFITAGDKGVLKVWSTFSGECLFTQTDSPIILPENSNYNGSLITQGSYIPALDAIGIATFEQNVILYSLQNFSLMKQFVGYNDDILSIKFMGNEDSHLAVATNSSQIKIFNFPDFSCQLLRGHLDIVLALDVFHHFPNILISGSKDNNVIVWYMDPEKKIISHCFTCFGHADSVTAVACCNRRKSRFFISASEDTTIKIWDVPEKLLDGSYNSLKPRCTVKAHDKNINCIDISVNDKFIATGSQDHKAKIWNSSDLSLLGVLQGHKRGVWCINFSPVDLAVVTSSGDETIRIWSLIDYSCIKVFQGHEASVLQVYFLSSGIQLMSSAADGNLKLWDIKNNMCIKTLAEHDAKIWALTFSTNEEYAVSGAADSNIIVWKDVTKEELSKKIAEKEEFIAQEQEFHNLIHEKNWSKALSLAINLDKPYHAYNIIKEILFEKDGEEKVGELFKEMRRDQKEGLLKFAVEWITNAKTCHSASLLMNLFYKTFTFQEMMETPNMSAYIRDSLPYLDRHFKRLNKKCLDMQLLEFVTYKLK